MAEGESQLVDIAAFGHRFDDYPAGLAENLITLEKEGAIYAHFADTEKGPDEDENWTFRYYRIPFLPPEIFQYVEASLAYQEYSDAAASGGDFEEALSAISDPLIAERVRDYTPFGRELGPDDEDIRGCFASFFPPGMEDLVCGQRIDRYEELPELGETRDRVALVMQAVNNFPVVARILRERQRERPPFALESEYDVQDLIFAVLRSVFDDARREEWTPRQAGSAKRIDILIPSVGVALETKYVRSKRHATEVADELRVDFECYHGRPECQHLVALVFDPEGFLPDAAQFSNDLSGLRQKAGHSFEVTVLVRS